MVSVKFLMLLTTHSLIRELEAFWLNKVRMRSNFSGNNFRRGLMRIRNLFTENRLGRNGGSRPKPGNSGTRDAIGGSLAEVGVFLVSVFVMERHASRAVPHLKRGVALLTEQVLGQIEEKNAYSAV